MAGRALQREADVQRVWVLVRDQPEGTWGVGGQVVRYAELVALAMEGRAQAVHA